MKNTLYIFNPSTEIVLASGAHSFTPKKKIIEFERRLSLLPALYAKAEGYIWARWCPEDCLPALPYFQTMQERGMRVICGQKIPTAIARQITQISPWGWNPALRTDLLNVGISSVALPSADELQSLRRLASRQTAVNVWKNILTEAGASCPDYASRLNTLAPAFFTDSGEAVDYARNRREGVAIKLPWSSSGRGVFLCRPTEMPTIEVRINQCLSSQGAVEIEPLWPKSLDFATEWICRDGNARFQGFSLFSCDSAGKYLGNLVAPEDAKISMITEHCRPEILALAVNLLEKSLNSLIAPHYSGPLGVDMLVSADGLINPCVEINLRQTMGHVSLSLRAFSSRKFIFIPGEPLPAN